MTAHWQRRQNVEMEGLKFKLEQEKKKLFLAVLGFEF
jgi:hypothetical protein